MRPLIAAMIFFAGLAHAGCTLCHPGEMQTRHEGDYDYCYRCEGTNRSLFADWVAVKSVACDQEPPLPQPPPPATPCTAAQSPATCECHEVCGPVVGLQYCMTDGTWGDCQGCLCAPDLSVPDLGQSDQSSVD